MNSLPPELHGYICELACIESGNTIRNLNMVSVYFSEITKPHLYRNMAVSTVEQMIALSERLSITPVHLRRIRHLFLSDASSETSTPNPPATSSHSRSGDSSKILRPFMQIIMYAAPTLQTLSLCSWSPLSTSLIARVFRTRFPILRRLSIFGFYPFPSSPEKFPSLEYLHLSGNRNPSGLLQLWTLEDACPSLKGLHISGLNAAGSFVTEVEKALLSKGKTEDALESTDCLTFPRFPPRLKTLVLQAGPVPNRDLGEMVLLSDSVMMDGLEGLKSSKTDDNVVEVSVLQRSLCRPSPADLREEWGTGILM